MISLSKGPPPRRSRPMRSSATMTIPGMSSSPWRSRFLVYWNEGLTNSCNDAREKGASVRPHGKMVALYHQRIGITFPWAQAGRCAVRSAAQQQRAAAERRVTVHEEQLAARASRNELHQTGRPRTCLAPPRPAGRAAAIQAIPPNGQRGP